MSIGDAWKANMGSLAKEEAFKLLDAFVDAGGNFIDSSSNYQDDESELWIGEWMKARGIRDELVIAGFHPLAGEGARIFDLLFSHLAPARTDGWIVLVRRP